jgi:hypothetical protein
MLLRLRPNLSFEPHRFSISPVRCDMLVICFAFVGSLYAQRPFSHSARNLAASALAACVLLSCLRHTGFCVALRVDALFRVSFNLS